MKTKRIRFSLSYAALAVVLQAGSTTFPAQAIEEVPLQGPETNLRVPSNLSKELLKAVTQATIAFEEAVAGDPAADMDVAIPKLESASKRAPNCHLPPYYLGLAYKAKRQLPLARKWLEKAGKLRPRFYEAQTELADVYCGLREVNRALRLFDEALAVHATYLPALDGKARLLSRLDRLGEAKATVAKALSVEDSLERRAMLRKIADAIRGPIQENKFTFETEHFKVTSAVSESLSREIASSAERVYALLVRCFGNGNMPAFRRPIWVIENGKTSGTVAGNPLPASGHYEESFARIRLVRGGSMESTLSRLNHLVVHQYLHEHVGRVPVWVDEGLAEYFGGYSHIHGKKSGLVPGLDPGCLETVRRLLLYKHAAPAAEVIETLSSEETLGPQVLHTHIAQAWALIHFILECKPNDKALGLALAKTSYRETFGLYLSLLRKGSAPEDAYEETFGKIDMKEFDEKWRFHVSKAIKTQTEEGWSTKANEWASGWTLRISRHGCIQP